LSGSRLGDWERLPELSNSGSPPAKPEDYLLDLASKSTDIFGNSCSMFTLEPETYTMELFASKKEFPKG
jgi:hypothetical protein